MLKVLASTAMIADDDGRPLWRIHGLDYDMHSFVQQHPGGALARRLHLHAWRLRLPDGRQLEAPLPPHFRESLAALGLAVPGADWQFAP